MTPTEFQKLQKQYEEIGNKIEQGQKLLNDMNQLDSLEKQVRNGDFFELKINEESFYINYLGLKNENIKKVLIELINKQYQEYMQQWEDLK